MNLKLENLSKSYQPHTPVLQNLNFQAEIHSLAIIGSSGCGKSTLLRLIAGLLLPTDGRLWLGENEVVFHEEVLPAYRKSIGYVFQQNGLFRHWTARENIMKPLLLVHNYSPAAAQKRTDELLTRFGLAAEADKKPAALSGGQQQRAAIARAIAAKPQILLLDEPTSALDPEYTNEVLDIIDELKKEGLDFIIVTHEMGFARHACDKIAFLAEGKLLEYEDSDTIFNHPQTPQLQKFLGKMLEWNI